MEDDIWAPADWTEVAAPKSLGPDALDVWMLSSPARGDTLADTLRVLTADERAGASRITAERERVLHVRGRALARTLLASYLGCESAEIRFETGRWGKPRVASPAGSPCFNIAHSGDTVVAAFGRAEVGVDVERRRARADVAGIAQRFYGDAESDWIAGLDTREQLDSFLRLWTRKEAVVKATGLPLIPFSREAVVLSGGVRGSVILTDGGTSHPVHWLDLDMEEGYTAAVATIGMPPHPRLRRIVSR